MLRKVADADLDNRRDEEHPALDTIECEHSSTPIVAVRKANRPIMIDTNASSYVRAVLMQP